MKDVNAKPRIITQNFRRITRFSMADGTNESTHKFRRTPHGEIFAAGSVVRESGIYEVLHDADHRFAHEVVMIADELFPNCDICDNRVKYRVVRTAPYIFSDEDFEEPSN